MKRSETTMCFAAACMGMAFFGITMVALGSLLPALSAKLALAEGQKALLATSLTGGIFLGSIIFGPVCDRYGHKGIFLTACILVLAGLCGIALSTQFGLLVPSYLCIGTGGGILNGQTNTLASDLYDDEQSRGSKLSLLGAFYGVGGIVITALIWLVGNQAFESIVLGIAAVLLLGIIVSAAIHFPAPKQPQSFPLGQAVKLLAQPALLIMSLVLLLESSVESITNNLSTTYFANLEGAVLLLTFNMVGLTVARFIMTWLSTRISQQKMLYGFLTVLLVGFILLSQARGIELALTAMTLIGVGTAATYPVVLGLLGGKFRELSGTAFGIAITIALAGSTVLNALVGGLLLHIYPYVMMCCVVVMIVLFTLGARSLKK